MKNNIHHKQEYEQLEPRNIPSDYYNFSFYVSKERMITYWHQVNEVLAKQPEKVLEVGIGNGIVASILKSYGINTITADINESLRPDVVVSITELNTFFKDREFPFVLCARVLQHLPFSKFDQVLSQLCYVTGKYVLLTLPVETMRLYLRFRVTGSKPVVLSVPFPLITKRILQSLLKVTDNSKNSKSQNFWKINQKSEVSMSKVRQIIEKYFRIEKAYQVPEDMSHAFFVLSKKQHLQLNLVTNNC